MRLDHLLSRERRARAKAQAPIPRSSRSASERARPDHGRPKGRKTDIILTDKNSSLYRFQGLPEHGGLAQLEERVLCKHEVIGSSPIFSTMRADSSVG